MSVVADLHLHSKYSRAVSPNMEIPEMSRQARRKGITLLATGDWTHPAWFRHLEKELEEWQPGIYLSKKIGEGTKFLLSTEISCIFSQGGRVRRIHLLVFSPSLEVCRQIIAELTRRGAKLASDGRPILGLSCIELCEVVFGADPSCMVIPAHAWTPWFGVYGSKGGFNSLAEAFGPYAEQIMAIETGLSSDPEMNWRVEELNDRAIISFSDAHSPNKMGRELTVFVENKEQSSLLHDLTGTSSSKANQVFTYKDIYHALAAVKTKHNAGKLKLGYTIEYYPEEGKYHWDGHRNCDFVQPPAETRKKGKICPVCGKELTIGVEYRVEELADVKSKVQTERLPDGAQYFLAPGRLPYFKLLPLIEIVSLALGKAVTSKAVQTTYDALMRDDRNEFELLLKTSIETLQNIAGAEIAKAVAQVRRGELDIKPGFDGEYGIVKLHSAETSDSVDQLGLF